MIKLISTDFDGTLFAEFEDPPIPLLLQQRIGELQQAGAKWVINTGRDMSSLMETLGRAQLTVKPDFLVLVEREIFGHINSRYAADETWNRHCAQAHDALFRRVEPDVPKIQSWIEHRFRAMFYADEFSPFCLIAERRADADVIHEYLTDYARTVPQLSIVRNDVSSRFSHEAYNKGTALAEIARQIGVGPSETFAVGDHFNDVPMLSRRYAHWLGAPANAIPEVKELVRNQSGFVSDRLQGHGVLASLDHHLSQCPKP